MKKEQERDGYISDPFVVKADKDLIILSGMAARLVGVTIRSTSCNSAMSKKDRTSGKSRTKIKEER